MNRTEIADQLREIADAIDPPDEPMAKACVLQVAVRIDGQTMHVQQMTLRVGGQWLLPTGIRPEGWPGQRGVDVVVTRWEDQ